MARIHISTMQKELAFSQQRFYKDDRVRLRSSRVEKGIVISREDGGNVFVHWDIHPDVVTLHNSRYLENVWVDPETGKEEK